MFSLDFVEALVHNLGEGVLVLNQAGNIAFANPIAEKKLGWETGDLIEQDFFDIVYIKDQTGQLHNSKVHPLKRIINFGFKLVDQEATLIHRDRHLIRILYTATQFRLDGNDYYTLIVFRDITQRRMREKQLELAQEMTQTGSWELDLLTNTVIWSDNLYRLHGYEPQELELDFETAVDFYHPDDVDYVREIIQNAIDNGQPFSFKARLIRRDESIIIAQSIGRVEYKKPGEPVRLWGTFQDITTDYLRQKKIEQSEARYRAILETVGVGVLLMDLDGNILQSNPVWERFFGREQFEENQNLVDLFVDEHRGEFLYWFNQLKRNRLDLVEQQWRIHTKLSETIWIRLRMTLVLEESNLPTNVVAVVEDVTEKKHTQDELAEVRRRLSRSREKERVHIAREIHDGPMQNLYGAAYNLQAIRNQLNGNRLSGTIEDTISLFQDVNNELREICADLRPPTLTPFGLGPTLRSHIEKIQARYPDITFGLDLFEEELRLDSDLSMTCFRLCQEMLNNTLKHAEATSVLIRYGINNNQILLELQDNGKGFELPERWVDLAREGHFGLIGAQERVEEIGGELTIFTSPGDGTIVRIEAPFVGA